MVNDDLVERLKDFGFNTYQSKTYISLAMKGALTAPEAAKLSKIPKSKIYEVLSSLIDRRMIEEFPGSPKLFKARPLDHVLEDLMNEQEVKMKQLRENAEKLKKASHKVLNSDAYLFSRNVIWTVNGRKAFHEKMSEMAMKAQKEVIAISPRFSRHPLLDKAMQDAKSRGVKFNGITNVNKDTLHRILYYSRYVNMRSYDTEIPLTIVIVDGKECLYRIEYEAEGTMNYVGVHSTNIGLVKTFMHYWNSLWQDSKEIDLDKLSVSDGK